MIQPPMCYCPPPTGEYWSGALFGFVMALLLVALIRASGGRVLIERIRSSWSQADAED